MASSTTQKDRKLIFLINHGLGDVIMTLPSLINVDQNLSNNIKLYFIVKSQVELAMIKLVKWQHPIEILSLEHKGRWNIFRIISLAFYLRKIRADLFIAPHASEGLFPNIFARILNVSVSIGPEGRYAAFGFHKTVPEMYRQAHKVTYYAKYFKYAGLLEINNKKVELDIPSESVKKACNSLKTKLSSRWVFLAPGSSPVELHKRWPVSYYSQLVRKILDYAPDVKVALIGSPNEKDLLIRIVSAFENEKSRCKVFNDPDLSISIALIRQANCLISGCTGSGHMGTLVGTPLVGIYGPTNPSVTGPYTKKIHIIRKGYKCSPCYRNNFIHGCSTPVCMTGVKVDEVFQAVCRVLEDKPYPSHEIIETTQAVEYEE